MYQAHLIASMNVGASAHRSFKIIENLKAASVTDFVSTTNASISLDDIIHELLCMAIYIQLAHDTKELVKMSAHK